MANETFEGAVNSVAQSTDLPQSQGAFQKESAQQSLTNVEQRGDRALTAREVADRANQKLAAIENVTPEINQFTKDGLEKLVRSHEIKSQMSEVQAGFWGFVRNTFGKDPAQRNRARGEQQIQGAVQYIRETGATGRAMTSEDESRHQKNREAAKQKIEKASESRGMGLREKIFTWANEKATHAMAKHEQLSNAIGSLREQIAQVTQTVGEGLQRKVEDVQEIRNVRQQEATQSAEEFQQSVSQAQNANYTGYGQPGQQQG
jgi:hypothetical protein